MSSRGRLVSRGLSWFKVVSWRYWYWDSSAVVAALLNRWQHAYRLSCLRYWRSPFSGCLSISENIRIPTHHTYISSLLCHSLRLGQAISIITVWEKGRNSWCCALCSLWWSASSNIIGWRLIYNLHCSLNCTKLSVIVLRCSILLWIRAKLSRNWKSWC